MTLSKLLCFHLFAGIMGDFALRPLVKHVRPVGDDVPPPPSSILEPTAGKEG